MLLMKAILHFWGTLSSRISKFGHDQTNSHRVISKSFGVGRRMLVLHKTEVLKVVWPQWQQTNVKNGQCKNTSTSAISICCIGECQPAVTHMWIVSKLVTQFNRYNENIRFNVDNIFRKSLSHLQWKRQQREYWMLSPRWILSCCLSRVKLSRPDQREDGWEYQVMTVGRQFYDGSRRLFWLCSMVPPD